ncbi:MAG: tRNA (adenosine(37)-N6)-threonylcarbamoyltransferase complex dimerization subunit type 1 TsaB [Candidatus Omnitrophota bacterium]|nr:tRNA (adenosine(37)-N6)-threonylcarbamoyltransferase complex dimerization subunit type 1 TsaB [Candidatus Omnitrophota bacterium]MBU1928588.1 tRNA (adenosine(37)-N6)-threonylcarbamoyltransferase complex dimerization subunit type 1 TsaB [Candidatus Omnitrophota bacterium]MBU2034601.1 tRNA (adenosine(37)-N6)-threonylcarbamoyltransferase complex dimerization subunit type 1 TsaB [Candidatus Omnitrophota bacterium]MBU2221972.1 tRNA (adenosine(37)-N6)-threonylcarbamoyltransferase complex dimerizati
MKILGIDTSTKYLGLGLYDNGKFYEYKLELGIRLSAILASTIQRVLNTLGWKVKDINYFACGLGPGSFTGLRIGLATMKGLAWSSRKSIIGIPTLDILAQGANTPGDIVMPIVDAKRGLVYGALYRFQMGELKKLMPDSLLTPGAFLSKAKKIISSKKYNNIQIFGDGLDLIKDKTYPGLKKVMILDKDRWYPRPGNILSLALDRIKDKKFDNVFRIEPIYLYPKDCQVRK